jgi:hypothetical protein
VLDFLAFDARYADWAERLAGGVTGTRRPVGSGTVARTGRIPRAAGRGRRDRLDAPPDDRIRPMAIPRVERTAA